MSTQYTHPALVTLRQVSAHQTYLTQTLIPLCLFVNILFGLDGPAFGLEKYGRPLPSMEKDKEHAEGEEREAQESLIGG